MASAYTGDFGNWSPLRKLITGNCSQVGSGRQLSGSTGRQGKPASKKAAMCPLVTLPSTKALGHSWAARGCGRRQHRLRWPRPRPPCEGAFALVEVPEVMQQGIASHRLTSGRVYASRTVHAPLRACVCACAQVDRPMDCRLLQATPRYREPPALPLGSS